MAGFLLFGTLQTALMQWLLEWESKEERYSVRELRRHIFFFKFHFCFFNCTRVAHQGIQMALRGLVALQFLFLILYYMCIYISHLCLWGSFMYEWEWVSQLSKHPKRNEKAWPVNSVS